MNKLFEVLTYSGRNSNDIPALHSHYFHVRSYDELVERLKKDDYYGKFFTRDSKPTSHIKIKEVNFITVTDLKIGITYNIRVHG